jgi:CBS domain-containing protein
MCGTAAGPRGTGAVGLPPRPKLGFGPMRPVGMGRSSCGPDPRAALHFHLVTDLTERAVASRVPGLIDEKLKQLSVRDPLTVAPGTSLQACLDLIRAAGTADSVFVVDANHRLLGVLTERDIFGRLTAPGADLDQPVEQMMVDHPNTLHLDQPIRRAIELMQTGRFRNVPLVDEVGTLVGVVRPVDVLKYLAEAFPEELLNLPPRPHQLMDAPEGA